MFSKNASGGWLRRSLHKFIWDFQCLVFQVSLRRFPVGRDSLEVKKIIKVKFLWITAAMAGHFYEWVIVFLEKLPGDSVPKWFHNGFVYIRQNDSNQFRDNLHKELNGIKYFFSKETIFLILDTTSQKLL